MVTSIKLSEDDAQAMYIAYNTYESQIALIRLITKEEMHESYLTFLKQEWEEARKAWFELELLKSEMDKKYHPKDEHNYQHFDFNFQNNTINFYTEG